MFPNWETHWNPLHYINQTKVVGFHEVEVVLSPHYFEQISQLDLYFFQVGQLITYPSSKLTIKQIKWKMTPSCSEIRNWSCWLSNDVGLSILHFHVYISGRQISIEFTVSFFLIPKNLQVFFWVPFGHQTTKTRVRGTEFPKSFPLSSLEIQQFS